LGGFQKIGFADEGTRVMDYTILIVDDEVEMCRSLAELFEAEGYRALYTTVPAHKLRAGWGGVGKEERLYKTYLGIRL
jgi:hypothetical protein